VHRSRVSIAHAPSDLSRALQAGLDRLVEFFLDAACCAQELVDTQFALAQEIAGRTRTRSDRCQQVRARRAFLLLLRKCIRNPFYEGEFGLEAATGDHPSDLPGIEKTANFSSIWPAVPAPVGSLGGGANG
jgi:hypothetical protein